MKSGANIFCARAEIDARVDREQALLFLGHSGQKVTADLEGRLEKLAQRCERENTPHATWRTFAVNASHNDATAISLEKCGVALPGADIAAHLSGARFATLMAVTIGSAWGRTIEELQATSPTDALLYDACASALTEAAADAAHAAIARDTAAASLVARARFSPGYGDLPLEIHPAFLRTLDANRQIGVFTTQSNLLTPAKSITAIIGLFPQDTPAGPAGSMQANAPSSPNSKRTRTCPTCAARTYCNFLAQGKTCC